MSMRMLFLNHLGKLQHLAHFKNKPEDILKITSAHVQTNVCIK